MQTQPDKYFERIEEPDNPLGKIRERHPSFGTIGIHNVQGSAALFESDILHNHFVELTITEAERVIDGARTWIFGGRKSLATVRMSAAQFAELITTPNRGSGTPCTIAYMAGDNYDTRFGERPAPPMPEPFTERYKREAGERAKLLLDHMQHCQALVKELVDKTVKPTKANLKQLQSDLYMSIMQIKDNMPFVMEQLEEGIEKRMQAAVTEFESYVGLSLKQIGLEHLQSQAPRLPEGIAEPKQLDQGE